MPNTKQFEAIDLMDFFCNPGKKTKISMVEFSEVAYKHIEAVYEFLDDDKIVTIEVPEEDCFYHLKRKSSSVFLLTYVGENEILPKELSAIETVNWLFAKAPFISMIGYSNI